MVARQLIGWRRTAVLVGAAAVMLVVGACGDDEPAEPVVFTPTQPTLTHDTPLTTHRTPTTTSSAAAPDVPAEPEVVVMQAVEPTTTTTKAAPTTTSTTEVPPTTTVTTTPPITTTSTTLPPVSVESEGGCRGEFAGDAERVRDQCVLDRLQYIFVTILAGTHAEHMSVVRDGYLLADMLASLEAHYEKVWEERGWDPPWLFQDVDARPYRDFTVEWGAWTSPDAIGVMISGPSGPMTAGPAVWVDGDWMVSYSEYCAHLSRNRGVKELGLACPKDPRPELALRDYRWRPPDLTDEQYDSIMRVIVW